MAILVGIARDRGVSGYVGDGSNRWSASHRLDVADLFRLALERAPAGSTLHAVAEDGVPLHKVAEVIGRHLELPVAAISPEDAGEHFGFLAAFLAADSPASSAVTRELLGWQPSHNRAHRRSRPGPLLLHRIRRRVSRRSDYLPLTIGEGNFRRCDTKNAS